MSIYLSCDPIKHCVLAQFRFFTPPPIRERSFVMSVSVCLSVCLCGCLSVRDHIFGTTRTIFINFLCTAINCAQ